MSRPLVLTLTVFLLPSTAQAADDRGVSVGGSVSAMNMDARTSWSAAGSFEYRLNRVAGLEIEVTVAPRLKTDYPGVIPLTLSPVPVPGTTLPTIYPPPSFTSQRGRLVMLTNNVRLHIPSTNERLDPYFVAGGGVASVRQSAEFVYPPFFFPADFAPSITSVLPRVPITLPYSNTTTALALTLGGGVGVRLMSQLWIDGDLRLFRLLDSDDRNVGRFGVGVRYRF